MRSFTTHSVLSLITTKGSCLMWTALISFGTLQLAWAEGGGGGGDLGDGGGSGPEPSQGWFMLFGTLVLIGIGLYTRNRKKGHQ